MISMGRWSKILKFASGVIIYKESGVRKSPHNIGFITTVLSVEILSALYLRTTSLRNEAENSIFSQHVFRKNKSNAR